MRFTYREHLVISQRAPGSVWNIVLVMRAETNRLVASKWFTDSEGSQASRWVKLLIDLSDSFMPPYALRVAKPPETFDEE